jgi:hypothetical protein
MPIDLELKHLVAPELDAGETILWIDKPSPLRMAAKPKGCFLFALVCTGAVVYFSVLNRTDFSGGAGGSAEPRGFSFVSLIPILIFGVLVALTNLLFPLLEYLKARRTVYSITNKRILVLETGRSRKVQSYSRDDIGDIARAEHRDGSGDLTFAKKVHNDSDGDRRTEEIKLVGIPEVQTVEKLVRDVFKGDGT